MLCFIKPEHFLFWFFYVFILPIDECLLTFYTIICRINKNGLNGQKTNKKRLYFFIYCIYLLYINNRFIFLSDGEI